MDEYLGLKLGHRIKAELFLIADRAFDLGLTIGAGRVAGLPGIDAAAAQHPELYKEIAVKRRRAHDQAA